jgi:hypothetical protein
MAKHALFCSYGLFGRPEWEPGNFGYMLKLSPLGCLPIMEVFPLRVQSAR